MLTFDGLISRHLSTYIVILLSLCSWSENSAKMKVFTYNCNRPDFIEIQHETFSKFLKDDYEFIVFNDARDPRHFDQISITCERLGIKHIPIPQEIHNRPGFDCSVTEFSKRNCNVVRYSLETLGFDHDDIVALIDGDLFLVKEFSIRDYLKGYDLAGHLREGRPIKYLWIGLAFLDMARMPNKKTISFDCGWIDNMEVDSGGYSYHYLKNNPEAKVAYMNELCLSEYACQNYEIKAYDNIHTQSFEALKQLGYDPDMISFIKSGPTDMELFLNGTFLHYAGSCNWARQSAGYHASKSQILNDYIEKVLSKPGKTSARADIGTCTDGHCIQSKPRVSIITSVFKGDEFIEGFMKDITEQTIFSKKDENGSYVCELLLINANSPGSEEKIIAPYLEKYPNIVYEKLQADPGLYAVWNRAIEKAQGEFITNANIDDRLAPQSLELHLAYFENHPEADIVYSNNYWTEEKNETFQEREKKQPELSQTLDNGGSVWSTTPPFSPRALISGLTCGHHPMWRKSIHARFGWFDTQYKSAADWDMWCRAYIGGAQFAKLPEFLGSYYKNPQGLSTATNDQDRIHKEANSIYTKYVNAIR